MATVRELVTRFGFQVDQTGVNRVEGSINRLSGMLQGIAAFASLRALAGVADSMQSLEARIGMLPQTIGDVGAAFNEVSKHAIDNRQSLAAYGAFYTKVGNAAKGLITEQKQLLQVTDTISQALVVGGANTMEAQSAMLQFGQALGSGVLQGDEFRSMAEAAPQYLDALANAMDIPRENLKKMASEGKLTSKSVIEATLKMSSMFQEKFRQMPMTIGQATTIIGNKFSTMVGNMNRESQIVTNVANFLLDGFEKIGNGAKSFIEFVGGSSNALKVLGIGLAAIIGPIALGGLIAALGAILSIGGLVVGSLVLIGLAIDDIVNGLNGADSIFGRFLNWLKEGSLLASALEGVMITLTGVFASWALSVVSAWATTSAAALAGGIKIAAAWLIALGPIGLVIAGIAAVSAAIMYLFNNWEKVKGFFSNFISSGTAPSINAGTVAGAAASGGTNVNSTQVVNVTVPPGTPESQQQFLKNAAGAAMSEGQDKRMAREMAMVAP